MKNLIALIALALPLFATAEDQPEPITIPLPVPVEVTTTVTTTALSSAPVAESVLFDFIHEEAGIKFVGVEARIVVKGEAFRTVMAQNRDTLIAGLVQAAQIQLTPAPTPAPTPEPTPEG